MKGQGLFHERHGPGRQGADHAHLPRADPPEARLTAAALAAIVARHDPD
jgi:hypothetical protein